MRSSPILAFRPARVVERLPPRSAACLLSSVELLGPVAAAGAVLPLVHAPVAGIARAALLAAREAGSALGLQLTGGVDPGRWFTGVAAAADELAAGLPIFLAGEVSLAGEGPTQLDAALAHAWHLVDAGITHLALDATAVAPGERARLVAAAAEPALARGLGLEVVVPLADAGQRAARAALLVEGLARLGVRPDLVGVRCPAAAGADEARLQAAALARLAEAVGGVPLMRRGPQSAAVLEALAGGPARAVSDGGAATARAVEVIPWELLPTGGARGPRASELEAAVDELSAEGHDRLEARAYVEVADLLERIGAAGSAAVIVRALEARLAEDASRPLRGARR